MALEVDGRSLKFQERDGRFAEALEVSIVAADERSKVQATERQMFEMNLLPQTREKISGTGVRLLSRLAVPPGRYQIRVGVHETSGGTLATVPYDLEVEDYLEVTIRDEQRSPDLVWRGRVGDGQPGSGAETNPPDGAECVARVLTRGDADLVH